LAAELTAWWNTLLGTPVIALHGALGDGKSSVLNLLRKALDLQITGASPRQGIGRTH
jgi:putative ribosome biogenesis GTPase RsgA